MEENTLTSIDYEEQLVSEMAKEMIKQIDIEILKDLKVIASDPYYSVRDKKDFEFD